MPDLAACPTGGTTQAYMDSVGLTLTEVEDRCEAACSNYYWFRTVPSTGEPATEITVCTWRRFTGCAIHLPATATTMRTARRT